MIKIRRYQSSDIDSLVGVFNTIESGSALGNYRLARILHKNEQAGGRTWILKSDGNIAGYATLSPVPALNGLFDLGGGIEPTSRRRGFGSRLLAHVIDEVENSEVRLITASVESTENQIARFLIARGFEVEHTEWGLELDNLEVLNLPHAPDGYRLETYPKNRAIKMFRELYESSFADVPWYQPYLSDREVSAEMEDDDSILFLVEGRSPVGFIWFRWPEPKLAELEPLGIIRSHQGQGLGRFLLASGLIRAAEQGADKIKVGVWSINDRAAQLYLDLGFRQVRTLTYLAYNVSSR